MNEFSFRNSLFRITLAIAGVAALFCEAGCEPYGGAHQVPVPRVRDIDNLDLAPMATTAPSTEPTTQPTTAPAAERTITLEEVRQMALRNNLELKVDLLNPTISKTSLSEEESQFEALFTTDASFGVTDTPTDSVLNSSSSKDLRIQPGIQLPLQTGGVINLGLPIDRFETNNQFSTLNPAYSSDLSASISQPLLRGAGVATNTHRIRLAYYSYQISEAQTKLDVIRVLATADRAYWRLYAARKDLEVRKKEYDLAVAQLERAKRQVEFGAAAEVEILRAESGVADTVETIITADNALRDRQRELKRIINEPGLGMETPTIIIPGTLPHPVPYKLDPEKVIRTALSQRMELLQLELQIFQDTSSVDFARNDMLPLVSLDYTYNVNGLGPSFDDSFHMVAEKHYEDHRVGIHMEVPLGNEGARSRLRRALANRMQTLSSKEQQTVAIEQDVYNALDQLEANWQRILASQKRTILAARVLDAEVRQFEQQLRTSTDVLDAQTKLADAQSAEIAAITEYQISQVDVAFATGLVLGSSGVAWQPAAAPNR